MKNLILSLFVLVSVFGFSQNKYNFDNPWRAKSNEGISDWYLDALDSTSDTLLLKLFEYAGTNLSEAMWLYPTDYLDTIFQNGFEYYSQNIYFVDNKNKSVTCIEKKYNENTLPIKLYQLFYTKSEGVKYLVLTEYF